MSTRRPYHHGDLRATLVETTAALLAEVGVEGLSLREVSRQAGVSHTAAYNHFRDKAELLRAVVDAAFVRLGRELARALDTGTDAGDALERIGVAYVRFAYRNQPEFRIMFRPELCGGPPGEGDGAYGVLVETVRAGQAQGRIAAGPIEPAVLAAWSMVHGLASLIVDGPDRRLAPSLSAAEAHARSCVTVLRRGLGAKGNGSSAEVR